MADIVKAAFRFLEFKIPNFLYNESSKKEATLNIQITPTGFYNNGLFEIWLDLSATDNDDKDFTILQIKCVAIFKFDGELKFENIPRFFYANSIAIVFPYIRAFISNLTLQANTGLIILDLMNLSNLEVELFENTKDISNQ